MWSSRPGRVTTMKWRPAEGLAAGLAGIALAGALAMMPAHAASERALFISLGAAARAPVGWKEFCVEYAPECDTVPLAPTDVVLTSQDWNELVRINEWVNDTVNTTSVGASGTVSHSGAYS